jgi:DNA-binding transcriptional MerR regulator
MTQLRSVREAAEQTGVSVYTLHYYEREGLLRTSRTPSGHRRYSDGDLEWIGILTCLRDTGMPIRTMRIFAELVRQDQRNIPERIRILERHRSEVLERILELQHNLEHVEAKIGYYHDVLRTAETSSPALENTSAAQDRPNLSVAGIEV